MGEDEIFGLVATIISLAIILYGVKIVYGSVSGAVNNISMKLAKREATKKYNEAKILWKKEENLHQDREHQRIKQQKKDDNSAYDLTVSEWEEKKEKTQKAVEEKNEKTIKAWEEKKVEYSKRYEEEKEKYQNLKKDYQDLDQSALNIYLARVLEINHKQFDFTTESRASFNLESEMAIVDVQLPSPSEIPKLKEVNYLSTKDELREVFFTERQIDKLYDDVIYKLCLADISQLFQTDETEKLKGIIYNGWVNTIDKATGQYVNSCIISINVEKNKFEEINLSRVDAKDCFRRLKGVGSSKLHGITPVAPISTIDTKDDRFVAPENVGSKLSEGDNLASMDWQEFEHLVREVFEKFFSRDDYQVKITQSSRDQGVDAIAFDPDPIKGGKIVIQAKRYTNVVGVSAVRDLYGTTLNEGAMKGILVTTSYFGSDSYDFAKDKPLTLIDGGKFLSMLNDIGVQSHIDLEEAKKNAVNE